jgi:hypothetical protein
MCLAFLCSCLAALACLGFTFAPASAPRQGTEADAAVLDGQPVAFTRSAEQLGQRVTRVVQHSTSGGVRVECRTETVATGLLFEFTVTNGWTQRLDSIDIRLPEVGTPPDTRIYSPLRGGSVADVGQGSTGNWPGPAYSPIVTAYSGDDALALTYLNRQLKPVQCFWFQGQGWWNPFLRYRLDLDPGESITLTADYRIMQGGPAAHWAYYRQYRLMPFMRDLDIPEATLDLPPGPIVYSNFTDDIRRDVAAAKAKGAAAFIQWSPPDAHSYFYNPYPPSLPWFEDLPAPGLPVGVLINPFVSPPLLADRVALTTEARYSHTNLMLNLGGNRAYNARLMAALRQRGVALAFFDTGGEPSPRNSHEWLRLLADWKRAGISILPETSCDVAVWTTGGMTLFPYGWNDIDLARTVTPKGTITCYMNTPDIRNGIDWRDDAARRGVRPIIHIDTLKGGN